MPAGAASLSAEAGSLGSCVGEEPDGRRRLPRTCDTEPEGRSGLGVEDSMFAFEAGASWADRPGRSSGEEGLGAGRTVLADGREVGGVDGSSDDTMG